MTELSHCATVECAASAEAAYSFLADASRLGSWALGCWGAEPVAADTVRGRSLFDGGESFVRVVGEEASLTVRYHVGGDAGSLRPRIVAHVVPGAVLDRAAETCLVSLLAWRGAGMSDERWRRLTASHETEILLVRARIEELA